MTIFVSVSPVTSFVSVSPVTSFVSVSPVQLSIYYASVLAIKKLFTDKIYVE